MAQEEVFGAERCVERPSGESVSEIEGHAQRVVAVRGQPEGTFGRSAGREAEAPSVGSRDLGTQVGNPDAGGPAGLSALSEPSAQGRRQIERHALKGSFADVEIGSDIAGRERYGDPFPEDPGISRLGGEVPRSGRPGGESVVVGHRDLHAAETADAGQDGVAAVRRPESGGVPQPVVAGTAQCSGRNPGPGALLSEERDGGVAADGEGVVRQCGSGTGQGGRPGVVLHPQERQGVLRLGPSGGNSGREHQNGSGTQRCDTVFHDVFSV